MSQTSTGLSRHERGAPVRIYSYADLAGLGITYSRVTINRKVKDGTFPKPTQLGENRIGWPEPVIAEWQKGLATGTLVKKSKAA
jgi:hypothetical protein